MGWIRLLLAMVLVATPSASAFSSSSCTLSRVWTTSSHELAAAAGSVVEETTKVPITLLSGFLGSGKTCTLKHLLENTQDVKIGVIVNDVASVNIDSKLVKSTETTTGIVELQNGCACCSLADELMTSVNALLMTGVGDEQGRELDAVVVELSGVADPMAIKNNWRDAKAKDHPVTEKADISQVVTLIDATTFGTDWMSWDKAGDRKDWAGQSDDDDHCAANQKVPELLAEQVEAANVILVNKIDLAGPHQVNVASSLARTLNQDAKIETVEYGRVMPDTVIKPRDEKKKSVVDDVGGVNDIDDMSLAELKALMLDLKGVDGSLPVGASLEEARDFVWDQVVHYESDHDESSTAAATSSTTSVDQLGITHFVYKSTRPFNTKKLMTLLNDWPVPMKDDLDLSLLEDAQEERGYEVDGGSYSGTSPFGGVLRSKGFCWMAPTKWFGANEDAYRHDAAMYWSHAGKHFAISKAGKWWGSIELKEMKRHFQKDPAEFEKILRESFVTEEFGDRRQEIVFIGVNMSEEKITAALNNCLISKDGMSRYQEAMENLMRKKEKLGKSQKRHYFL